MSSCTQRSLKLLRGNGYLTAVVERWNPHARKRQDLFGFADIVAIRADVPGILAVQTTSASNQAARITKIRSVPAAATWLAAANKIEVHGWQKRAGRWAVTVTEVTLSREAAGA